MRPPNLGPSSDGVAIRAAPPATYSDFLVQRMPNRDIIRELVVSLRRAVRRRRHTPRETSPARTS
jgi:hypothetical protein